MWLNFWIIFVVGNYLHVSAEKVLFPYGVKFQTVDLSELSTDDQDRYALPLDTGSFVYDSMATEKTLTKRLAMNIQVQNFTVQDVRYFRAHPVFLKCAEQAIIRLIQQDISVTILRGYISATESTGSFEDLHHQGGTAMELSIRDGSSGTLEDIAAAVFKACPIIVEREMRDLGVVIMADRVHFRMSAIISPGPIYLLDGYSGISDIDSWAQEKINEGLVPQADLDCTNFVDLNSGDQHPVDKDQSSVVGTLDVKITRNTEKDFKRLVQYQGSLIEFEDSENDGVCSYINTRGNSIPLRCADRVMSTRLLAVMKKLSKLVWNRMGDILFVIDAWSERDDPDLDPLHFEGRAARIHVGSTDDAKLSELSKYAACAGADFIKHKGTEVFVAVKRMKAGGKKVTFPSIELLSVDVPEVSESLYNLPSVFSESEAAKYPLFDSGGRLETPLSTNTIIRHFVSKDYRYFRLNPKIVECYQSVLYSENQRLNEGDSPVEMEIVRGFMTNKENNKKFDVAKDARYNSHNLGRAMQVKYRNTTQSSVYTPYRLFYKFLDRCAPIFHEAGKAIGIGLYNDSVFVDIRPTFTLMNKSKDFLPDGVDVYTFDDVIEARWNLAKNRRVVEPDDLKTACSFQTAPKPQDPGFKHEHSEVVKRKRRRRRSADDNKCVPTRDTDFCDMTKIHREKEVVEMTSMLDRKHYTHNSRDVIQTALKGCFEDCGTCLEGEVWDDKSQHCNEFLHWVNWTLSNNEPSTTNFFVSLASHACEHGNDCVENSPLFSLIAPTLMKIFRPDPKKRSEESVYSSAKNPSPAMSLMEDIYGIQASGLVKFWVVNDAEMTALKRQLEVVMLYNKNVTHIEVYIENYKNSKDAVVGIIEKAARTMARQGCPYVTRETLTPYSVHEVPADRKRRAAEGPSQKRKLLAEKYNLEERFRKRSGHGF